MNITRLAADRTRRNSILAIAAAAALCLPALNAASALDWKEARAQGLLCEKPDGFLAAAGGATPEIKAMVADINNTRRDLYAQTAAQNGVPVAEVGRTAFRQELSQYACR
jgi:uncharacterized protein YdbL (DUF1318 family)